MASVNRFPPHIYWDGRCFPSHLTSFGSSSNSSSSPSTLLGFENNFDQEESLFNDPNANDFEEVQDDEPIGYTPQLSAVWNNDDSDWEDNTAQIEETFDNLLLGKVRKQKDETVTIEKKEIKSNSNHSFAMVVLFQKFSYYYLSTENDYCGEDRFANVEESDLFLIHLPSETIRASKKLLISKSNFFKLMIESQMKESNENQVDFSSVSNEEGLDTLKIVNFIRYGNAGVPIRGTAFPLNLEDYGSNLIGIVDLLRLLDVADKFGVASFIWAVTDILNQYNVMILLEKALQISPELGNILIDACASVISENLPCVLGGLVYEGVVDQFLQVIPSNTDEWSTKCREIYKIFKKDQTLDGKTENLFVLLQTLKSNPTVNYLVDVLPSDIFIRVMKLTTHYGDDFAGIFTLWIFSSSFETCFQDYDTLENLETDNFIYRLLEGVTIVLNSVNANTLDIHRSVFLLLLPILRYYSRSYPSDFQCLLSKYVIGTSRYAIGFYYHGSNELSNHLVAPMLRECFKNHQNLPENDMVELYSQAFIDPSDNSFIMENAQRIIPHLFASMLKESDIANEITKLMSYVLMNEFKELVAKESTKVVFQTTKIKKIGEQNALKTYNTDLFGLDASGKTLILERLKAPNSIKMVQTIQTIGFNNESISYAGVPINVVDIGGSVKIRGLWKNFISPNIPDLIVMVVDLSDQQRFQEAREAFDKLMSNVNTQYYYGENNNQLSILLLANKTDCIPDKELRSSLQSELFQIFETSPYLDPSKLKSNNHRFKFMSCSAKTGEGIEEIWAWFLEEEFIGKYSVMMDNRYFIPLPITSEWRTAH